MRPFRLLLLALGFAALTASGALAQVVNVTANVTSNTTWGPTGSTGFVGTTFWVKNSISVSSGATLTIQPGVVVKFAQYSQLTVNGALRAVGDSLNRIYFTSIKDDNNPAGDTNADGNATVPASSDWYGVVFSSTSVNGGSKLSYDYVRYGGYNSTASLVFQSVSDSVNNCTITKSYYGVDCQGTAAPVMSNTTIQASTMTPIILDFASAPVFSSLVFSNSDNGYDAIGLRGGTLATAASLPKRGATVGSNTVASVTYVLLSSLTVSATGSLTVSPGVVIKPLNGTGITVSGSLAMNGTGAAGDTITVTSISDDNFGSPNDTNNNGSVTAPARADWSGISYLAGSTGSLSYCRLKFGYNTVQEANASVNIANSLLSDALHGLVFTGVASPTVTNVQINNCSSTPVLQSVSSNAAFSGVGLLANAITAIGIQGEQVSVNSHLTQRTLGGYANMTYYIMGGQLQIMTGATLTVDPGVVVKNQISTGTTAKSGLQIDGALIANGTPASPIVFTSERDDQYGNPGDTNGDGSATTPAVSDWTCIRFTDTSNDAACLLNYCRIAYGSWWPVYSYGYYYNDTYASNLWTINASPTITNTVIYKGIYGIRVEGNSAPVLGTDTFDNLTTPVVMSVLSDPQIATSNTFTTNTYNAIALFTETLSQNASLKYRPGVGNPASPTFCYLPTGTITVPSGVTLTVQPQVILKPNSNTTIFDVYGALNMVGADNGANRIFVTSYLDDALGGDASPTNNGSPQAGNWGTIAFNSTAVGSACVVRNVKFQFGGGTNGVLYTNGASPRFANLEFFQNVTAFRIAASCSPTLDSLNILNCTSLPIVTSLLSSPAYGPTIMFANCAYLGLGIASETIAQDVTLGVGRIGPYSNLNYILAGSVYIAFGAKWTIKPGVVLKMGRSSSGNYVDVSGALYASGKPDSLIVFTSTADDAFGQDAMGDGAATQPTAGDWANIKFESVSNDAATLMNYCRVRYSGGSGGSLNFQNAGPAISNTQITLSYMPAAYVAGASTPVFTNVDFDSCTANAYGVPVQMSLVSDPVFSNCRFQGNWLNALGVIPETIAQDLTWRIRPVAGRQNMPYFLSGIGGTLTIGLGATLTIQPGIIIKGGWSASILIQRALTAIGGSAPESLIVFTSYKDDFYGGDSNADSSYTTPTTGDWGYIQIDGTAIDPQVNFKNCVFRYCTSGSTTGALRCVSSAPTVDSCLFAYNGVGISAEGSSNPLVRGCSFCGNTSYAINNTGAAFCVSAPGCWWGSASGPKDASATADLCGLGTNAGTGDAVSNNVNYTGYATSGILNPLLGDVSLNGYVLAYDASLALQSTVALITLTPLQALVADVDATGDVSAFDASLILQYVAGKIAAFPPISNSAQKAPVLPAALRSLVDGARGNFQLALGQATRDGDGWRVPVTVTGTAPVYSAELTLDQIDSASLVSVVPAEGALLAQNVADGSARIAMASTDALPGSEVMVLRFAAGAGEFRAPHVAFARVNQQTLTHTPPPAPLPGVSLLGRPAPNPARGHATLQLAVSTADATPHASVRIVDVAGRTLRTLVDGPLDAGTHTLEWNLADDAGRVVPAGMYFVRARTARSTFTQRLVVVR